ncbi:MAG: hypothetical protein J6128_05045 [Clostridia bacterium]|nr:hypothetical protein [Clostridia bacterium]
MPVRLRYRYVEGTLTLSEPFYPGDGAQYSRDMKQYFSKTARTKLNEMTNEEYQALQEMCLKRACQVFGMEYGPDVLIVPTQTEK